MLCCGRHDTGGKWLLIVILSLTAVACAVHRESDVPRIESYLPRLPSEPPAVGEVLPGMEDQRPAHEKRPDAVQARPLDLEACLRIALDRNPSARAAQEGINIARETAGEVGGAYYPELRGSGGYSRWQRRAFLPAGIVQPGIPSIIGPTDDWMAALTARYTLFDSGERQARLRAALAGQGAAEEEAASIRQDIALNVHKAFYNLAMAREILNVARENLARAEDDLRLTIERKEVGDVPKADVLRARVEVAREKLSLVRAENLVRVTKGSLNTAMGLPVELDVQIAAHLGKIDAPEAFKIHDALHRAVRARPELRAALQRIAAGRYAVRGAKSAFGPKLRTEGSYGLRDVEFLPRDEEWAIGVFAELPIFSGFSDLHRLNRTKAELAKEEAETAQLVLNVRQEVWSAYSQLKQAYEAIQVAEVEVEDAEESMRLTRERYEVGAGTINDLLDAQTALARARANQVEMQWQYRIAGAEFQRAVGEMALPTNESRLPE